ncbi:MAG: hypothetical protein JXR37_08725 [Kiritimatiellae bacterium]|nr:hypothetical protein [Kiritimatiellia bacterium]
MPSTPGIGQSAGQHYDVARAIQTFLGQMAEGGIKVGSAVIKELLQNADDAGASEVQVILDERQHGSDLHKDYSPLLSPALLVRNNAPFRDKDDVAPGDQDDFTAICDVASGHKRFQATAAGRFGIGLNSVYFLTDTPVLFSRREVHVFDLLHRIFPANGWRFPLDDFRAAAQTEAGPLKTVLERILPKVALGSDLPFGAIAGDPTGDYRQALLRLPLRQQNTGAKPLYPDLFASEEVRLGLLDEMSVQAARAILFLKNVDRIQFGVLTEEGVATIALIEATAHPLEFRRFEDSVREAAKQMTQSSELKCAYPRTVTFRRWAGEVTTEESVWPFHVRHTARFDDPDLLDFRQRLQRNQERAVPWASIGIPLGVEAIRIDGTDAPQWRVFLPLLEPGPSGCIFSAGLFVGPSRQRVEFRIDGSDDARRKTDWNRLLVEKGVVPLLREASLDMLDLVPKLIQDHPREYLALFPLAGPDGAPQSLAQHLQACFSKEPWCLRLHDLWGETVEILIGGESTSISMDMVPDWLAAYGDRFHALSCVERRFIRWSLGDALRARLGSQASVSVQRAVSADVARCVLVHDEPPDPQDLDKLISRSAESGAVLTPKGLSGCWAFCRAGDGNPLKYEPEALYIVQSGDAELPIHRAFQSSHLSFDGVEWVSAKAGLPLLPTEQRRQIENVSEADEAAALQLLRRVSSRYGHDSLASAGDIAPVVDFLAGVDAVRLPPDLHLGFLIRTAHNTSDRRSMGTVLLRPESKSDEDTALWEGLFRRNFPQVDPSFSREIHRLLSQQPGLVDALATADCGVAIPDANNALAIFARARRSAPERFPTIEEEVNRPTVKAHAEKAAGVLLEIANRHWDSLDEECRLTLQALPIHRTADGRLVSLCDPMGADQSSVRARFRLQSQDDIKDAPITVPECRLLHSADRMIVRFYRQRLGLEEHGRAAVLKDVLRQIGEPDRDNRSLLAYLVRHYSETIQRLSESPEPGYKRDAEEMAALLTDARVVPCLDGKWRRAQEVSGAWPAAERLRRQGWHKKDIGPLLTALFDKLSISDLDGAVRDSLSRFCEIESLDVRQLACQAVTSESRDLSLAQRFKVLIDNWEDRPADATRAEALSDVTVPSLTGRTAFPEAEILSQAILHLPQPILSYLAPKAVDLQALADEVGLSAAKARQVLEYIGVATVDAAVCDERLRSGFKGIWKTLEKRNRLALLEHVAGRANLAKALSTEVSTESVVLVSEDHWAPPANVVCPKWLDTKPTNLPASKLPYVDSVSANVRSLWDSWCGIAGFSQVLDTMLTHIRTMGTAKWLRSAADLYDWIDRAASWKQSSPSDLQTALGELPWVCAEKATEVRFLLPAEVIVHRGGDVLKHRFWVATRLPAYAKKMTATPGFLTAPEPSEENLEALCECLAAAQETDPQGLASVYSLVAELLGEDERLAPVWDRLAATQSVFHLFRGSGQPDTRLGVFLGTGQHQDDIGQQILCLKRSPENLPKGLRQTLQRLGVPDSPTAEQAAHALCTISGPVKDHRAAYEVLVALLVDSEVEVDSRIRVPACSGKFEPLADCYWDEELGQPGRLEPGARRWLIHAPDRTTRRLIEWVGRHPRSPVLLLRKCARRQITESPRADETSTMSQVLGPWRDLLAELHRDGSVFREQITDVMGSLPVHAVNVAAVDRIRVRYELPGGDVVDQSSSWGGPQAAHDGKATIFVQQALTATARGDTAADAIVTDRLIATEVVDLLRTSASTTNDNEAAAAQELILQHLERPSVLLTRMRQENQDHFFHQYHDQVADPEFAKLFEEYRKTSSRSPRRQELEENMRQIMEREYVDARRDQIRGYGYDEFSVFAELVQNAEDAYLQRHRLGMDPLEHRPVTFRYVPNGGDGQSLYVEHYGRPFNYWRHGKHEDANYSRDVEGVLRSAGSFKPHTTTATEAERTVGRFGLGFKCVYLITDRPAIHSGWWHFAIEAGCLPVEVPPPTEIPLGATRIELPLREDAELLREDASRQLINLLPFLREVDSIELCDARTETRLRLCVDETWSCGDGVIGELVSIEGASFLRANRVRFLRLRQADHAGQMAFLLADDGLPAAWAEAFAYDAFVVLPLHARLGCGVGISSRFEVQSGRTHLVDPEANAQRFAEVAALIRRVPAALRKCAEVGSIHPEMFRRFWCIWRWHGGDNETEQLRRNLAETLAALPEADRVVPTFDKSSCISLHDTPAFYFRGVPEKVRMALLTSGMPVNHEDGQQRVLAPDNTVPDDFVTAYLQTCRYAEVVPTARLVPLDWKAIGISCREFAWLVEHPDVLNAIAAAFPERNWGEVLAWLRECPVAGIDGNGRRTEACPSELHAPEFDGMSHLPSRLLTVLGDGYDAAAVQLLKDAGLQTRPTAKTIHHWISDGQLTAGECNGLLRYLVDKQRFMDRQYRQLDEVLRTPWVPSGRRRLTTADAADAGLIARDVLSDDLFKAWIGLSSSPPPPPLPSRLNSQQATRWLNDLFEWWRMNGAGWTSRYEERVYPSGSPFVVRPDFQPNDRRDRKEWLSLFMLGAFHTMGRQTAEQHRGFLRLCDRKGWLDVFADPQIDAASWMRVLEGYLDEKVDQADYYQWISHFVRIFHLSRWLPQCVESFLATNRIRKPFSLDHIVAPRASAIFQGGGPDAPPITRALGTGACFVMRELTRMQVLNQPHVWRHCFVPARRVRQVLWIAGCDEIDVAPGGGVAVSSTIYEFLVRRLGDQEKATFGRSFDLPLLAAANGEGPGTQLPQTVDDVELNDDI